MRGSDRLSAIHVKQAKPGRYCDGRGLYLQVTEEGNRCWMFRYSLRGRPRWMGLGPSYSVSLAEARERARQCRQLLLEGRDPIEAKHEAAAAAKLERLKVVTFRQAATDFLATTRVQNFRNDKHRAQWRSTLEQHAFPVIGDVPLQAIDTALVLQVLMPVWRRTPETGSRLRGRIERVIDWAKPLGLFQGDNPAAWQLLKDHLPAKAAREHHKALPYVEMPTFMERLRSRDSVSARALEFAVLTAARTNEVTGATWGEIDLDHAVWTIPAARMKGKRDHRVPLTERAVAILRSQPRTSAYVFARGKPLSNMAMLQLLRGMEGNGYTVHGFRSAFSDWARDRTAYSRDLIEQCLAHVIKDKSEAAYRRGDALEKRTRLMAEWAKYCEAPQVKGKVIPMATRGVV